MMKINAFELWCRVDRLRTLQVLAYEHVSVQLGAVRVRAAESEVEEAGRGGVLGNEVGHRATRELVRGVIAPGVCHAPPYCCGVESHAHQALCAFTYAGHLRTVSGGEVSAQCMLTFVALMKAE